jgi:hypothetical protein
MSPRLLVLAFSFLVHFAYSQKEVTKDYFRFPIKPGKTNYLTGNFGELRANHFHGGIDIKTDFRTGLPVYAAAEGYISRVVVSSYGYGNLLFVTHPNGYVTVYAHLEKFNYAIGNFVKEIQYKNKSFEIDERPAAYRFPVTKEQIIAYSGNTGSSGGPHLHFEIRDSSNNLYNPLYFGFDEIKDDIPPIITKLALRPLDIDSRINGEFSRYESPLSGKRGKYKLNKPVSVKGLIGLELVTNDKQNGSGHLNGIACLELYLDGKEIFHYNMDAFPYDENPNVNIHLDYETLKRKGNYFHRCYKMDGNRLPNYRDKLNGKFRIDDQLSHKVKVVVFDAYQNKSELEVELTGGVPESIPAARWLQKLPPYELGENYLKINMPFKKNEDSVGIYFVAGTPIEQKYLYHSKNHAVFIWDMRNGLPDSFVFHQRKTAFDFSNQISPNMVSKHSNTYMDIHFPKHSIFDTLYLRLKPLSLNKDSTILNFEVNDPYMPLYSYIYLSINTKGKLKYSDKYAVYNTNSGIKYLGGTWKDGIIDFKTKVLGKFSIREDTKAPQLRLAKKNRKTIMVTMRDNLSGIKSFNGYIDGQWVLFNYEHKKNLIWTTAELSNIPLKGDLLIQVEDYCGNISELKAKLK